MRLKSKIIVSAKQIFLYLKDYRFSSILIKYFLLLFICLALPVIVLSVWYGHQLKNDLQEEIVMRNENALEQAYDNVEAVILSAKNMSYSLATYKGVQYLSIKDSVFEDTTGNIDGLRSMISIICNADEYIDSIYIYFQGSGEIVSNQGIRLLEDFQDKECFEQYSEDMPTRVVYESRQKNGKYPYLLSILYPIRVGRHTKNEGCVVINIDVEELGNYVGSGQYHNKDYSPMLIIYDDNMENMIFSDEYKMLRDGKDTYGLSDFPVSEHIYSEVINLEGENYVVSGACEKQEGFRYFYVSSMLRFEQQKLSTDRMFAAITIFTGVICFILALLLSVWVYRPIRNTMHILEDVSMLTEWDRKEAVDEMEAIQRSILLAKEEKDSLNEQIQKRIISLHNAQICALQTQINPHFLYNTLESIGNAAALLMEGENKVTEMIYSLGLLMRISLAGENYLVPLTEELEHVKLYVKLLDFRFRGRIKLCIDIPEELYNEKIVKLTLQPLIENAIEHGLAKKRKDGQISIIGEKAGNKNYIHVIDNGSGITKGELIQLREKLKTSSVDGGKHIGLRNVDQRLKLVFGEEYGLKLEQAEGTGLKVSICYRDV